MLDTDTVNPKTLGERVAEWLDNWVPDNRHIIDELALSEQTILPDNALNISV